MKRLTSKNPLTGNDAMNLSLTDLYMRLKVYEDADVEGRLLVLPCKVGDVVYFACASWVRGQPIVGTTSVNPVFFDPAVMWDFSNNHFKRNYFLTREEAEAALMGGADG